ncbi:MAG: 50S ribosomal protein L17 [Wolbachia endosymbiont of Menacanthus eurysternus]|nr:MAG: 50S ribosomal protein L17 [Wolbachia endosymbiont of Menacanthus eurysternus]
MKHRIKKRKLSRCTGHRLSMLKNLSISLINHEQIVTTLAKAKELRPYVERLITIAKKNSNKNNVLYARRVLLSRLYNNNLVVNKLLNVLVDRYCSRNGGYSRIIRLNPRRGDCASMAVIELVDRDIKAKGSSSKNADVVEKKKEIPS